MNRLKNNVRKFMTNMMKSSRTCVFRDFGQGSFCVKLTRPVVNLEIFFWRLCCKTPTTIRADVNKAQQPRVSAVLSTWLVGDSTSCRGKSWREHDVMTRLRKRQRKHCPSLTQLTPERTNRSQLRCETRSTNNLNISRTKRYIIPFVACYTVLTHSLQFPILKLNIDCLSVCSISLSTPI